jgi:hypothetical protein
MGEKKTLHDIGMLIGCPILIHLSMKEGCLFICHVETSQTMVPLATLFGVVRKPSMSRGCIE